MVDEEEEDAFLDLLEDEGIDENYFTSLRNDNSEGGEDEDEVDPDSALSIGAL
jgi:hypothetical protein